MLVRTEPVSAESLATLATRYRVDRIVMSSHGRPGYGRWRSSGLIERLRPAARCPITVIEPEAVDRKVV